MTATIAASLSDPLELVDRHGLARRLGVSLTTLDYDIRKQPDFPKPIQISERRLAWRAGTIAAWLTAREQAAA